MEVSGSHGGAKQQQRVFVVVGSCREPLGAIGSHWESLGAVGVNYVSLINQSTLLGGLLTHAQQRLVELRWREGLVDEGCREG